MKAHVCKKCGEQLLEQGEKFRCPYCGAIYDKGADIDEIASFFADEKMALLANRRRVLWDAAHRQNVSSAELSSAAQDVLSVYADDEMARFYLACLDKEATPLNDFLASAKPDPFTAREVLRFSLMSLDVRNVFALKAYLERSLKGEDLLAAYNLVEQETERIEEGTYLTNLPRDVFLAYSSADLPLAIKIADFLEDNEFTVFVAVRNLRHGKGAKENYQTALHDAMAHCKTVVFISTENSRRLGCDAMRFELPYIRDHFPKMNRIEFLGEDYGPQTKFAAKSILRSVFKDLEWCRDKEDLVERLLAFDAKEEEPIPQKEAPQPKPEPRPEPEPVFDEPIRKEPQPETPAEEPRPEPSHEEVPTKKGFMKSLFSGIAKEVKTGLAGTALMRDKLNLTDPMVEFKDGVLLRYKGYKTNLALPDEVKAIGPYAFKDSKVEVLQLPPYLKSIGEYAFRGSSIRRIGFPHAPALFIGEGAFQDCKNLGGLSITANKLEIDANAFRNCLSLTTGAFACDSLSIGLYAFADCRALTHIETARVTGSLKIQEGAFMNCRLLSVFNAAAKDVSIETDAFKGCNVRRRNFPKKADVSKDSGLK